MDGADGRLELAKRELKRLRQGHGMARPSALLSLDARFQRVLTGTPLPADNVEVVNRLTARLQGALGTLDEHQARYARVDFNLDERHTYPTLTERQASLASSLRCASKTVRRHADRALETLALALLTVQSSPAVALADPLPAGVDNSANGPGAPEHELRTFLQLPPRARVDIVCSEMPPEERPSFADPQDRNYLRYAKFADLDSLIYLRSRLSQSFPDLTIRDFSPSEYNDTSADALFVLGGPPWNATFRQFQAQLPFYFEPHPLGHDDPLVVPQLGEQRFGPAWAPDAVLLSDISVIVRLTFGGGLRVFLMAGCLTLGVLGAAKCFLDAGRGRRNADVVSGLAGERDFVLVTESTRVAGITDVAKLAAGGPLLLLVRGDDGQFTVAADNSRRHRYPRNPRGGS